MMDLIMIGILAVSFIALKFYTDWCDGQISTNNK